MHRLAKGPVAGAALAAAVANLIRSTSDTRGAKTQTTNANNTRRDRRVGSEAASPIRAYREWSPEADLHVQCGDLLFSCSRQLMSEVSRSVQEMLEASMPISEDEHPVIEIDELSQACVHTALEYLHNDIPLNMDDFQPESDYKISDSFREAAKYGADLGEAYAAYELCQAGHLLGSPMLQEYAMRCYNDARVRWWDPTVIASLCDLGEEREDARMMACKVRWLMFSISVWDKQVLSWQQTNGTVGELTELLWDTPKSQWYPDGYDKETRTFADGMDLRSIVHSC